MKLKVTISVENAEKFPGEVITAHSYIDSEQPFMKTALQVADIFRSVWTRFQTSSLRKGG